MQYFLIRQDLFYQWHYKENVYLKCNVQTRELNDIIKQQFLKFLNVLKKSKKISISIFIYEVLKERFMILNYIAFAIAPFRSLITIDNISDWELLCLNNIQYSDIIYDSHFDQRKKIRLFADNQDVIRSRSRLPDTEKFDFN